MKSRLTLITMGVLATLAISSCLQNEEPDGLKNMRDAQAEKIKAEANYNTASIALINAEAELQKSLAEGKKIDTKIQEVQVAIKELEVKAKESDIALEAKQLEAYKKYLELDAAVVAGETDAVIEELKFEKRKLDRDLEVLETEKKQIENQIESNKQKQEKMILDWEQEITIAKKNLAEAEAEYKKSLKEIETNKIGLSEAQQEQIKKLTNTIDQTRIQISNTLDNIADLKTLIVEIRASNDVSDDAAILQDQIKFAEKWFESMKSMRDEYSEVDINAEYGAIVALKKKYEAKIEEANARQNELELEYLEIEEKIQPLYEKQTELEIQANNLVGGSYEKIVEFYKSRDLFVTNPVTRTVNIPQNVLHFIGRDLMYYYNKLEFINVSSSDPMTELASYVVIDNPVKYDPTSANHILADNQLKWTCSAYNEYSKTAGDVIFILKSIYNTYRLNGTELDDLKAQLAILQNKYQKDKVIYDKLVSDWEKAVVKKVDAETKYGLVNGILIPNNMNHQASEALKKINEIQKSKATDDEKIAQMKPYCEVIYNEQKLRHDIANNALADFEKLNPNGETWSDDMKGVAFLSKYQTAVINMQDSSNDLRNIYAYKEVDSKFTSLRKTAWDLSLSLYQAPLEKPIESYYGVDPIWVFPRTSPADPYHPNDWSDINNYVVKLYIGENSEFADNLYDVNSIDLSMSYFEDKRFSEDYSSEEIYIEFDDREINGVTMNVANSVWYKIKETEAIIALVEEYIDAQAGFESLLTFIDDYKNEINANMEKFEEAHPGEDEIKRDIEKQIEALQVQYDKIEEEIKPLEDRQDEIDKEETILKSEANFYRQVIVKELNPLLENKKVSVLVSFINGPEFEEVSPEDDNLDKIQQEALKKLDKELKQMELTINEMKDYLAIMLENEANGKTIFIDYLTKRIETEETILDTYQKLYASYKLQLDKAIENLYK